MHRRFPARVQALFVSLPALLRQHELLEVSAALLVPAQQTSPLPSSRMALQGACIALSTTGNNISKHELTGRRERSRHITIATVATRWRSPRHDLQAD